MCGVYVPVLLLLHTHIFQFYLINYQYSYQLSILSLVRLLLLSLSPENFPPALAFAFWLTFEALVLVKSFGKGNRARHGSLTLHCLRAWETSTRCWWAIHGLTSLELCRPDHIARLPPSAAGS